MSFFGKLFRRSRKIEIDSKIIRLLKCEILSSEQMMGVESLVGRSLTEGELRLALFDMLGQELGTRACIAIMKFTETSRSIRPDDALPPEQNYPLW
jgi:hypothetical protein